jgi:hypothetical protein
VGQRPDAGDVADRPQALAGAQSRVDVDAARVGLDADRLQADVVDARSPAGGDEQAVAAQLAAVLELEHEVLAAASLVAASLAPGGRDARAEHELDPVASQHLAERLAERRGLTRQDVLRALHHHRLGAEAPHGLRHLHADRPGPQDEHAARNGLHGGRLAVGPDAVELAQPRDRRDDRVRTACDDDVVRRMADAVDLDDTSAGEPAAAAQQVDPRSRQPALLTRVRVLGDHEVAPRERRLDIDLRGRRRLARRMDRLARPQQRLRRYARPVRALAADQLALDERDAQPALGQRAGAVLARRAAAQHDDVVVVAHGDLRCPIVGRSASRHPHARRARGTPGRGPGLRSARRSWGDREAGTEPTLVPV